MIYKSSMNAKVLIKFLGRLIKGTTKKIFLILDNMRTHHAKLVQSWVEKHKDAIELFFLPPYALQHNPDEYLNGNLKCEIAKKGYSKTEDELESKTRGTMMKFQKNSSHVKAYFRAEKIQYAA